MKILKIYQKVHNGKSSEVQIKSGNKTKSTIIFLLVFLVFLVDFVVSGIAGSFQGKSNMLTRSCVEAQNSNLKLKQIINVTNSTIIWVSCYCLITQIFVIRFMSFFFLNLYFPIRIIKIYSFWAEVLMNAINILIVVHTIIY